MNFHVDVWSFYKPVLEHALTDWKDELAKEWLKNNLPVCR
jgi:hypothetical protein